MDNTHIVDVYKTSVSSKEQVEKLTPFLNRIPKIVDWNFDLEDCDHILRIVSTDTNPFAISELLMSFGFRCSELE
ncbi:MAG: hypothetical protein V4506_08140 [Bacteroidota bacterium]